MPGCRGARAKRGGTSELITATARRGEWRAAAFLYARVRGNPKETIETVEEPEIVKEMRSWTPEQRRDLLRQWNEEKDDAAEAAEAAG